MTIARLAIAGTKYFRREPIPNPRTGRLRVYQVIDTSDCAERTGTNIVYVHICRECSKRFTNDVREGSTDRSRQNTSSEPEIANQVLTSLSS